MTNNTTNTTTPSEKQHLNPFTCITCQVAFPSADKQRLHYRSDWHKYNLKRKVARLASVTAEQFAQKVLAQQSKEREEEDSLGLIYECVLCRKSYGSENAFSNHLLSRKHKESESLAEQKNTESPKMRQNKDNVLFSDAEEELTDNENKSCGLSTIVPHQTNTCLFCHQSHTDFDSNLNHMVLLHGFFLPDVEYLEDREGLIEYLAEKINDCICLYCNGRGKQWNSVDAVRKHMLDKGHCKMAYDESEDPEELLKYYNFGTMPEEDCVAATDDPIVQEDGELILDSGRVVHHRRFLRHFTHRPHKPSGTQLTTTPSDETAELPEPRNRRERRHRLLVTDGSAAPEKNLFVRLPESIQKIHRERDSYVSYLVVASRLRIQNPVV